MSNQAPAAARAAQRPKKPLWKKLGVAFGSLIVFAVLLEIAARVVGYCTNNFQTYYLLYGWKSWTNDAGEGHSEKFDGYYKFPPNRTLTAYGHTPTPVRINNHGFRGADFDAARTPGVKRVIAIGESSTFGYEDSDDGTYPYLLEVELNHGADGARKVEVLNCGIPHVNSENIAALLDHEVLGYQPDVLTLMCGYNDATYPLAETAGAKFSRVLDEYSAAYAGLRKFINKLGGSLENQWTAYAESMDAAHVATQLALHEQMTRTNLRKILELARDHHVPIVLIRQTMTGYFEAERLGHPMEKRPTYAEETTAAADKLATKGALHGFEARVYIHRKLMAIVEELAAEFHVPLVDNTKLVDEDVAKYLVTSVHLSEAANARLAHELSKVVAPLLK